MARPIGTAPAGGGSGRHVGGKTGERGARELSWDFFKFLGVACRVGELYLNILLDDGMHPCVSSARYDPPLPSSVWQ
jgi:hypothetical protein